jgi:hypothetical protein
MDMNVATEGNHAAGDTVDGTVDHQGIHGRAAHRATLLS